MYVYVLINSAWVRERERNLYQWKKKNSPNCILCGESQSLIHVLNACSIARNKRWYNYRHDDVLKEIVSVLSKYLLPPIKFTADLGSYNFPQHIVSTDLRPDIVWWNDSSRTMVIIELTIAFETSFQSASERKKIKYESLVQRARENGFSVRFISLEVGSRGIVNLPPFHSLKDLLKIRSPDFSQLLIKVASAAIRGSHQIWCSRNRQ